MLQLFSFCHFHCQVKANFILGSRRAKTISHKHFAAVMINLHFGNFFSPALIHIFLAKRIREINFVCFLVWRAFYGQTKVNSIGFFSRLKNVADRSSFKTETNQIYITGISSPVFISICLNLSFHHRQLDFNEYKCRKDFVFFLKFLSYGRLCEHKLKMIYGKQMFGATKFCYIENKKKQNCLCCSSETNLKQVESTILRKWN